MSTNQNTGFDSTSPVDPDAWLAWAPGTVGRPAEHGQRPALITLCAAVAAGFMLIQVPGSGLILGTLAVVAILGSMAFRGARSRRLRWAAIGVLCGLIAVVVFFLAFLTWMLTVGGARIG